MSNQALNAVLEDLDKDLGPEAALAWFTVVADYLAETRQGQGRVTTADSPAALMQRFEEPMPRGSRSTEAVLARLKEDVLPDVTRLTHPLYMGHQVSAPLPAAIWSEALISALNQSTAVREMGPSVNAIEHTLIRWFCGLAGLGEAAGGTLTSGGTEATFTALLAARAALFPRAWEEGIPHPPPVIVCGEHAHYSVKRAAGMMGLGTHRAVTVPSLGHRMDVEALARRLDELRSEKTPVMAVVATAGCTPTGSFDALERIGPLCTERGLWLHVDGAHGASALLSQTHREKLNGLHHARSLAWDPHKMMSMPLPAGMLLVRDVRQLEAAFAQEAPYLFHARAGQRSWDLGKLSFQCSRRADALKVWVALQRYGADGLGALYDHLCANAQRLYALLKGQPDFETLHEPESNILCFRHCPSGLPEAEWGAWNERLREQYHASGRGFITLTTLDGARVLRVSLMNPRTDDSHLLGLIEGLRTEARRLSAQGHAVR